MGTRGSDQGMAPVDLEDDASGQFAAEKEAVGLGTCDTQAKFATIALMATMKPIAQASSLNSRLATDGA